MRALNEIIVHCSATVEGKDYTVAQIRDWHVKGNGWKDIGYHYVIYRDGSVHPGRPLEQVGSHVAGRNTGTIGICYVGGVDARMQPKDTRTLAQIESLGRLISDLLRRFPSIRMVSGHRDYAAKACPCFNARAEYAPLLKHRGEQAPVLPSLGNDNVPATVGGGTTTASSLNLRRDPAVADNVIGPIPRGTSLIVYGSDGDWLNVQTPFGARGWVSRQYVKIAA
jgi:N-acetylmuramoyl-L-alanine amidase